LATRKRGTAGEDPARGVPGGPPPGGGSGGPPPAVRNRTGLSCNQRERPRTWRSCDRLLFSGCVFRLLIFFRLSFFVRLLFSRLCAVARAESFRPISERNVSAVETCGSDRPLTKLRTALSLVCVSRAVFRMPWCRRPVRRAVRTSEKLPVWVFIVRQGTASAESVKVRRASCLAGRLLFRVDGAIAECLSRPSSRCAHPR
jgi:hypothetical protein